MNFYLHLRIIVFITTAFNRDFDYYDKHRVVAEIFVKLIRYNFCIQTSFKTAIDFSGSNINALWMWV
jgi:hypothetical protein